MIIGAAAVKVGRLRSDVIGWGVKICLAIGISESMFAVE
jgi:hypothetical protein